MSHGLKKIDFDLFDILEEYPMATGYADGDGVSVQTRKKLPKKCGNFLFII